jgi:hypothetical protein
MIKAVHSEVLVVVVVQQAPEDLVAAAQLLGKEIMAAQVARIKLAFVLEVVAVAQVAEG